MCRAHSQAAGLAEQPERRDEGQVASRGGGRVVAAAGLGQRKTGRQEARRPGAVQPANGPATAEPRQACHQLSRLAQAPL